VQKWNGVNVSLRVDTEDWPSSKLSVTRYSYSRSTKCGYSNSHNYLEPLWCDWYPEVGKGQEFRLLVTAPDSRPDRRFRGRILIVGLQTAGFGCREVGLCIHAFERTFSIHGDTRYLFKTSKVIQDSLSP
jgi:hypothetical protein